MNKVTTASFIVYPASYEESKMLSAKGYTFSMMGCSNSYASEEQGLLEEEWLKQHNISFFAGYTKTLPLPESNGLFSPEVVSALVSIMRAPVYRQSYYWQGTAVSSKELELLTQNGDHFSYMMEYIDAYRRENHVDDVHMVH